MRQVVTPLAMDRRRSAVMPESSSNDEGTSRRTRKTRARNGGHAHCDAALVPPRNVLWPLVLLSPIAVACSSPQDPLGLARRKAEAPGADATISATSPLDASAGEGDAASAPAAPAPDASTADAAPAADAAPVVTQISDLAYVVVANGYGPAEKDTSNGEDAAGDGHPITLAGTVYPKGLGVHAASEVHVTLGGQYKTFLADVGVDDEVGANGSVVFQVSADGAQLFDSGTLNGGGTPKPVSVDVTGKQELVLLVTDSGDGIASDHADWAGARLVK